MATEPRASTTRRASRPYHLGVAQFQAMIRARIFPDGDRLELLGGIVFAKAARTAPHDSTVGMLGDAIRRLAPAGWIVREEKPIAIGERSQPEPDLAIVRGPWTRYTDRPPNQDEVAVAVEVAEATYAFDRADRWRIYATARIPAYWIVHVEARRVEVHLDPAGRARTAEYRKTEVFGPEAHLPLAIDGLEVGSIALKDLFP